ncbi:MAG: GNAT family N-acetyltransferase [Elusimicrobia bacterium]|nr:GNAT family N-acetyltransferase [Elusimicrobiota bacterium]
MTGAFSVRPYQKADEPAVRRICVDTARLGATRPAEWLFSSYWTMYYTRFELESAWVAADAGGELAGYLTGCLDTLRYRRVMKRAVLPWLAIKCTLLGTWALPASRLFLLNRIAAWSRPEEDPEGLLEKFPAHLHVNLLSPARRQGIGGALIGSFVECATRAGVPGIHLETLEENREACRFFERQGFTLFARKFPFRKIDPALADRAVAVYARPLPRSA